MFGGEGAPFVTRIRRFASFLALFALALQFGASFGHVHLDGIHSLYPAAGIAKFTAKAQPTNSAQPGNDGDKYCAICATIYLAGNSFVPQPPQLPTFSASQAVDYSDYAAIVFVAERRTPFQSRAPPSA
ncbi:MAG TPA: hypothetical protein VMV19_19820 [Xanthobacteraceae bacterium]|nr:hypothetical protein [Xanthobacteraceae bacterium]